MSTGISPERELAFGALLDFRKSGAWPDLYLKNRLQTLTKVQAALAASVTYGVLQNQGLIDYYIGSYSSIKLNKISPYVLESMRMAVYQIVFLDKVPDSAAVNDAVSLINKTGNRRASGFANGVLRRISREKNALPEVKGERAYVLSVKYSHPLWLTKRFIKLFCAEEAEELLASNNQNAEPTVRINTLKTSAEDFLPEAELLTGSPLKKAPLAQGAYYAADLGALLRSSLFEEGHFYVQDAASQAAVEVLSPRPGERLLDACAAPGGKSLLAAQLMENKGEIISNDIYPKKTELISANAAKYGASIIKASCKDVSLYSPEYADGFDRIICDVPCSGLGIIRKKPDIRFKDQKSLDGLPELQLAILSNTARYLKPGGRMIYTTCTVLPEENEGVLEAFLESCRDFDLRSFVLGGREYGGAVTLLPHRNGTDGFFISLLERRKESDG